MSCCWCVCLSVLFVSFFLLLVSCFVLFTVFVWCLSSFIGTMLTFVYHCNVLYFCLFIINPLHSIAQVFAVSSLSRAVWSLLCLSCVFTCCLLCVLVSASSCLHRVSPLCFCVVLCWLCFFFLFILRPPRSTLCPSPTFLRSSRLGAGSTRLSLMPSSSCLP